MKQVYLWFCKPTLLHKTGKPFGTSTWYCQPLKTKPVPVTIDSTNNYLYIPVVVVSSIIDLYKCDKYILVLKSAISVASKNC